MGCAGTAACPLELSTDAPRLVFDALFGRGEPPKNDRHNHDDLPVRLAGGGRGSLTPGRTVTAPKDTPLTNLHLPLPDCLSVRAERFGCRTKKS